MQTNSATLRNSGHLLFCSTKDERTYFLGMDDNIESGKTEFLYVGRDRRHRNVINLCKFSYTAMNGWYRENHERHDFVKWV